MRIPYLAQESYGSDSVSTRVGISKSRVVWECSPKKLLGGKFHLKLNIRWETDSKQVLRRKGEKNFEKRVK